MKRLKFMIRFILFGMLILILINSMKGERISVGNGAGWDGSLYMKICDNFSTEIANNKIDSYSFQRIVPFAIINIVVEVLNLKKEISTYLMLMSLINLGSIIIASVFFFLISEHYKFKVSTEIIAFSSLFFCYPILKLMGYYPLLTDYLSFSIGLSLFYFFIKRNTIAIVSLSLFGAFIWPTILMQGLLLAFMPRVDISPLMSKSTDNRFLKQQSFINLLILLLPVLVYLFFAVSHIFFGKFKVNMHRDVTNDSLQIYSMLISIFYFVLVFKQLYSKILNQIILFFSQCRIVNIVNFFFFLIFFQFIIYMFASDISRHTITAFLFEILAESLQAPLSNIINLFAYYGFGIILLIIYWKDFMSFVKKNGFAYLAVISMAFILSLGNESRYLINFIPFLIIPIFVELNNQFLNIKTVIIYLILSLALSRFWFQINVNGISDWNRYMLSQGPWQPFEYYLMFAFIFLFSFACLYLLFVRKTVKHIAG